MYIRSPSATQHGNSRSKVNKKNLSNWKELHHFCILRNFSKSENFLQMINSDAIWRPQLVEIRFCGIDCKIVIIGYKPAKQNWNLSGNVDSQDARLESIPMIYQMWLYIPKMNILCMKCLFHRIYQEIILDNRALYYYDSTKKSGETKWGGTGDSKYSIKISFSQIEKS